MPIPSLFPPPKPFDDEAYLQKRSFQPRSSLSLSPDGRWAAITLQGLTTGEDELDINGEAEPLQAISEELMGCEVLLVNLQTGAVQRPFQNFVASLLPTWSPDGRHLALLTQDSVRRFPRLTLWSPEETSPRVWEEARMSVLVAFQALRWTSDSQHLVFQSTALPGPAPFMERQTTQDAKGSGALKASLGVLDIKGKHIRLGGEMSRAWGWKISPDDRRVAFLRGVQTPAGALTNQANWRQLVVAALDDGSEQLIGAPQTDNWGCSFSWSSDGNAIAWVAAAHQVPPQIHIADLQDAQKWRSVQFPEGTTFGFRAVGAYPPPAPLWDARNTSFWVPGRGKVWRFTRDGQIDQPIVLPQDVGFEWLHNSVTALDFPRHWEADEHADLWLSRHSEFWKVKGTDHTVELVWKHDPDAPAISKHWNERAFDAGTSSLFTVRDLPEGTINLFATLLPQGETRQVATLWEGVGELQSGPIHSLSWALPDGTPCAGSLLLPLGWQDGEKPPVVMSVYGDQREQGNLSVAAFHNANGAVNPHLLSANGYAIFTPDLPQTDGQPAGSLVVAGEAAAQALRDSGLVDTERIAVIGQSYGGYTTLCLLTGSTQFKAGIVANGVYDLLQCAFDDDWGYVEAGQGRMRASLWEKPERYLENSPVYALDKLEAPLLIASGGSDTFGKKQSEALFSALRRLAKSGELLVYREQGHAPIYWSIAAQRDWHRRLLAFLAENLK